MVEQIRGWVEYKDAGLRERYEGRPIPMNLFVESYIDGKIDIHCDLHELMRATCSGTTPSAGPRRSSW